MSRGTERGIAEVAADNRGWVALGTVTAATAHASLGYVLDVTLQPSGREVQAQLAGRRLLLAAEVGDAVLVLFPDGDPNRAIALPAEIVSSAAPLPSSWTNGGPQVVDPDGLEVRTAEAATVQPLVTADFLTDLLAWATVVQSGLSALGVTPPTDLLTSLPTAYRTAALKSE